MAAPPKVSRNRAERFSVESIPFAGGRRQRGLSFPATNGRLGISSGRRRLNDSLSRLQPDLLDFKKGWLSKLNDHGTVMAPTSRPLCPPDDVVATRSQLPNGHVALSLLPVEETLVCPHRPESALLQGLASRRGDESLRVTFPFVRACGGFSTPVALFASRLQKRMARSIFPHVVTSKSSPCRGITASESWSVSIADWSGVASLILSRDGSAALSSG